MRTSKKWIGALLGVIVGAAPLCAAESNFLQTGAKQPDAPVVAPTPPPAVSSRWDAEQVAQPETVAPGEPAAGVAQVPCDICTDCCGPCLRWIGSVEATFFWPQFNRQFLNTGFTNDLGTVNIQNNASVGTAEGALFTAPRVTIGVTGECWGLVGRYFYGSSWANTFVPAFPDAVQSGTILFDNFRLATADLEVQRRFCWRYWDSVGFFGTRWAMANTDRSLAIQNSFGDSLINSSAFAGQQFNGAGVTMGFFATRPLWCDDGGLKLYYANRLSVLWGNGLATVQTSASLLNTTNGAEFTSTDGAYAKSDGDLFIYEAQLGLQWDGCLKCLPGRAFFRSGLEWQYWDTNAGVSAAANSVALDQTTGFNANSNTSAGDLLFRMIGFNIGAGFTY